MSVEYGQPLVRPFSLFKKLTGEITLKKALYAKPGLRVTKTKRDEMANHKHYSRAKSPSF